MKSFFSEKKKDIIQVIEGYLDESNGKLPSYSVKSDMISSFRSFSTRGKLIRGCLVLLGHDMYGGSQQEDALKAAAALELLHSCLLIHDDIIDNDEIRRGEKTIFAQYEAKGNNHHYGTSMGLCSGDVGIFLGYGLLAQMKSDEVVSFISNEFASVALAQMQELEYEFLKNPTAQDVLNMYKHKTAHYTISVPLMVGAKLAGRTNLDGLETFGEHLGVIFQIKDDELGLFGSEIGKVQGSDIKEGKKTIFWVKLMEKLADSDKEKLQGLVGKEVEPSDLEWARHLVKEHVYDEVMALVSEHEKQARALLEQLDCSEATKAILDEFISYLLKREK